MKGRFEESARLQALSRLFSFPEQWPRQDWLDAQPPGIGKWPEAGMDLPALQSVYVSLFINALPEVPCPPYGSYYLEGLLMGETTVRLERMYRGYGFELLEMADHIAVELEFLALLTRLAPQGASVQEDRRFLLAHLRRWTPDFFERVERHDRSGFYTGAVRSARRLLLS